MVAGDESVIQAQALQFALLATAVAALVPVALKRIFLTPVRRNWGGKRQPQTKPKARSRGRVLLDAPLADGMPLCDVLSGGSFPIIGLVVCLLYTLRFHFASTVHVEGPLCNTGGVDTPQFMPSISAAIGDHAPQVSAFLRAWGRRGCAWHVTARARRGCC